MTSLPSENETYLVSPACGGGAERSEAKGAYPPAARTGGRCRAQRDREGPSDAFCGKRPLDKPPAHSPGTMRTFLRMGVLGKTPAKRPNPRTTRLSQSTESTQTTRTCTQQSPRPSRNGRGGGVLRVGYWKGQWAGVKSAGATQPLWRKTCRMMRTTPWSQWGGARKGTRARRSWLPLVIRKPYLAQQSISASL